MNYSKGFRIGLFTIYDHPFLPLTNNDLELFFRKTKQKHRRFKQISSEYLNNIETKWREHNQCSMLVVLSKKK